ncbi:hypothetical protein F7725_017829 [Dissostichus mawsoni]|uniref:C-type lectin domain-containing protein n=1 Tax=Dissostichus mawsoni TaxID=36200 RepID=A0A7J5XPW2_DISMA|nr:hypothetical protein F7725_017829 [Dissostichus mawsoni]
MDLPEEGSSRSRLKSVTSEQTLSNSLRSAAGLQTLVHDEQKNSAGNGGAVDKKRTRPEEITEEADYVNAPEGPVDKKATRPEVQELNKLNQELETQKNNLTQQIQNMETTRNELNISRAQWSIDSYCLGNTGMFRSYILVIITMFSYAVMMLIVWTQLFQIKVSTLSEGLPSCYAINNPPSPGWRTWEEAREDCKGKNSDLAVARNPAEKEAINEKSFGSEGFWIGLRVVNKKWKWVDGSDLTDSLYLNIMFCPQLLDRSSLTVDGHCAVFYKDSNTMVSVSCDKPQQWICQKKALSRKSQKKLTM